MSLVEEIQAAALNRDIPVSDLLRRVKLAAAKLKLATTVDWVDKELNGYPSDDEVPAYRISSGSLMATTFHHGTRPAQGDPQSIAALSVCFFRESIGALEALVPSDNSTGHIVVGIDPAFAQLLPTGTRYDVYLGRNAVVAITDTVRNLVLNWAINLENEGILGEGVSFTVEEKKKAAETAPNIQITNYGHYHQGDVTGHQNRTVVGGNDSSVSALSEDVFADLRSTVESNVTGADRDVLLELIKSMEGTKSTPSFKQYYDRFLVAAATYMTIFGPFIPALTSYISG